MRLTVTLLCNEYPAMDIVVHIKLYKYP